MRFKDAAIAGVKIVEPDLHRDDRGFFTRLFCPQEFAGAGVDFTPLQMSLSRNLARYTLRGMHYCSQPEAKLVRCVRGRILDVLFDIRPSSATFLQSVGVELDAESARGVYVPSGVAHGFITLEDETDVVYNIDRIFVPDFDKGLRWNDPAFGFVWPMAPIIISERDSTYADFQI
jgi:dTDP-4-dehydrorhamnose 3,5-epimerase